MFEGKFLEKCFEVCEKEIFIMKTWNNYIRKPCPILYQLCICLI